MSEANSVGARPLGQFLRMAVMAGVESAVQIHIDRGDDLNARDASGMTPLMLSAVRNKAAICRLLLSAGADHRLLDRSGKTALVIATEAGSHATATILTAALALPSPVSRPELEIKPEMEATSEATIESSSIAKADALADLDSHAVLSELGAPLEPKSLSTFLAVEFGDCDFDLSGWEAEEDSTRPEDDNVVKDSASAVQIAITAHEPIDSSAEWADIKAYLPEEALPLAREDDAEGRARLRRLLLRAVREGSVPELDVQAQSINKDGLANPEAEAFLVMVVNDFGAEVDERFEYSNEKIEVFVDSEETPEEEAAIDEALAAIDRAASPRHEPLRIYQREFQRHRLLSAEEEIQCAKDMEAALDAALNALATWPNGINKTLSACAAAIAGSRQLSSIWLGGEPDPEPHSAETLEAEVPARADSQDAADEDGESLAKNPADVIAAHFAEAFRRLSALVERDDGQTASTQEIRQALANLRLNRRFFLELIDASECPAACSDFRSAIDNFRKARDRMAAANLKLSFFHAKKYLYSGEPLDDLAQEGNIGLLKAVDRFDWRRGFRFSTYATWWIRQQIGRHVADKVRSIRLPLHVYEKLQRAERMAQVFEAADGREPTLEELAKRVEMPPQKLAALLRIASEPSSIDELTIDSMIAIDARDSYAQPDPEDAVAKAQLIRAVDRYVSLLSVKDRKEESILRMRFGIGIYEPLTLDEVGVRFEVTRERIRQIEAKALRKLRDPARSALFARMALGLESKDNSLAPIEQEHEADVCPDTPGAEAAAPSARKRAHPLRPQPKLNQSDGSSKPIALEKVLAQAAELGVPVEDRRDTASGRIWVNLLATPDNSHRRLARKLIEFGFEYSPGKGYWR